MSDGRYDHKQQIPYSASPMGCHCLSSTSWHSPTKVDGRGEVKCFKNVPLKLFFLQSLLLSAYGVKVDEVTKVLRSAEQWAVVSSELLPSSMEVVGHHVNEVQFPGKTERVISKTFTELPFISLKEVLIAAH